MSGWKTYDPGSFEPEKHFYPRALNAQIHPLVQFFLGLGNKRIAERYIHLHPEVDRAAVVAALGTSTRYFKWGGADLLHVANDEGGRHFVIVETNSCPSGQKSIPLINEEKEQAGYETLLRRAFLPMTKKRKLQGELAVIWDKNQMEASGYAAALADLADEPVHLVSCFDGDPEPRTRFSEDGVLSVRTDEGWIPIRAALRYVTQRPWNRIPPIARTAIFNPVLACLAGGRNKMLAAKAYDFYNAELRDTGLNIGVPETIWDVSRDEVPIWVMRMGGFAVVKNPYSNAGQGVYTITSPEELEAFMDSDQHYDRFIVQALVGNSGWSSRGTDGRLFHVGTVPNKKSEIFVADLRFMVGSDGDGFFPVAIYARRARTPLVAELTPHASSWEMLGTNLSVRLGENQWKSETERLLLMDRRDFNRVGIGLDDLIDAYVQTALAVTAVDRMAAGLVTQKGRFRRRFFRTLNPDAALAEEIV